MKPVFRTLTLALAPATAGDIAGVPMRPIALPLRKETPGGAS